MCARVFWRRRNIVYDSAEEVGGSLEDVDPLDRARPDNDAHRSHDAHEDRNSARLENIVKPLCEYSGSISLEGMKQGRRKEGRRRGLYSLSNLFANLVYSGNTFLELAPRLSLIGE